VKKWQIVATIVVIVAVGLGAFFGGRATGGSSATTADELGAMQGPPANRPARPGGPPGAAGNMVAGSIISADDSSITVQTSDGSTKIVLLSDSTQITKSETGSMSDLTSGEDVVVNGTTNDDGTVTADSVRLGAGLGGGAPGAVDSSTATTAAQ
jgi:hypothetical protein